MTEFFAQSVEIYIGHASLEAVFLSQPPLKDSHTTKFWDIFRGGFLKSPMAEDDIRRWFNKQNIKKYARGI